MSKLDSYNGSIDLISGLRPKNNGDFPLMEAHDVQATETQRLDEMFQNPESWLPVYDGENEGGAEGGGSSGSSTVTRKVTLAELVALCTLENAGMLVNISANLSNMPNGNDGDLGGLLSTYGLTSLQADINYQETDNGNVFLISSAKTYSNGGTLFGLFVRLVTANGQIGINSYKLWGGSEEKTLASGELTDEYFNFYVIEKTITGSSSSGSSSTGLQVKQITFTDRPSLYSWLQTHTDNCINAFITTTQNNFIANTFVKGGGTDSGSSHTVTMSRSEVDIQDDYVAFVGTSAKIDTESVTLATGITIHIDETGISAGNYAQPQTITDDYWQPLGISVTITYIE